MQVRAKGGKGGQGGGGSKELWGGCCCWNTWRCVRLRVFWCDKACVFGGAAVWVCSTGGVVCKKDASGSVREGVVHCTVCR
jgi:hypothetical protein